ncbi:MAG: ATP-binding cassette domain-containing protein [Hylemonella sp.]|uniref:ABC transporter ATP-binding protein n=1 Tax=Hylemonella sp. TaxID=2066020 RepID=UPI0022BAF921|nr:ATP-binding cassette domain-containing protein [Hylemonella sp.]MCZ8252286.1 ATP-binding cassette domain-containing protein [Hylemonella sp.]
MIATRGLACQYPGGTRLTFPDLSLGQGETLLLRGRSGSGKSSWLALAAALMAPAAGEIIVAGQCLGAFGPAPADAWRARHIGFLPQKLHLSTALTVAGNLELVYYAAGLPLDRAAITAALQALGVAELAARWPAQLSGGQAQRVALARAVLLQPKVILADEPTASLDDEAARDALALLQASAQRCGATLVIATHDARVRAVYPEAQVLDLDRAREA